MSSFATFITQLPQVLDIIYKQTQKVFVPTSLSHSPIKPKEEFMIVLRTSDNVQSFPSKHWITNNIANLCKKFVIKTIKFDANFQPDSFHLKLNT